jgi:hypothetical protein
MKKYHIEIGGKPCGNYISFIDIIKGNHIQKVMDFTESYGFH